MKFIFFFTIIHSIVHFEQLSALICLLIFFVGGFNFIRAYRDLFIF
jgi:hypothetical protein